MIYDVGSFPKSIYRKRGAEKSDDKQEEGKTWNTTQIQNRSWHSKLDAYVLFFSFVLSKLIIIHGVVS